MLLFIYAIFVALASIVHAADQAPDVAFALAMEYRPTQEFRSCRSSPNVQTNCGFCYLRGSFLGWNCNCDDFCHNTLNECYYITEAAPSTYTKIECQRDALN